jgi:hypothetical protein
MSAQDFRSGVNRGSNHGLVRCIPVLQTVNLGDLGEMVFPDCTVASLASLGVWLGLD